MRMRDQRKYELPDGVDLDHLDQKTAAMLLGVESRTLRRWHEENPDGRKPPRNRDDTYNWNALLWWRTAERLRGNRA